MRFRPYPDLTAAERVVVRCHHLAQRRAAGYPPWPFFRDRFEFNLDGRVACRYRRELRAAADRLAETLLGPREVRSRGDLRDWKSHPGRLGVDPYSE